MTENERIKQVRKSINLTLEEFGAHIGITRAAMSKVENGRRNVTEQVRRAVCREFGVNEEWLLTGEGEMFLEPLSRQLDAIYQRHQLTPEDRIMMEEFLLLGPEVRRGILDYIHRVSKRLSQREDQQIDAEAAELAFQLREEKKEQEGGLSASPDTDSGAKMA